MSQGFSTRPQNFGVTIGPRTAVNFQPGCRFVLPSKGSATSALPAAAQKAASDNGYILTANRGGLYIFDKGNLKIRMAVTHTFVSGNIWVQAMISQTQ